MAPPPPAVRGARSSARRARHPARARPAGGRLVRRPPPPPAGVTARGRRRERRRRPGGHRARPHPPRPPPARPGPTDRPPPGPPPAPAELLEDVVEGHQGLLRRRLGVGKARTSADAAASRFPSSRPADGRSTPQAVVHDQREHPENRSHQPFDLRVQGDRDSMSRSGGYCPPVQPHEHTARRPAAGPAAGRRRRTCATPTCRPCPSTVEGHRLRHALVGEDRTDRTRVRGDGIFWSAAGSWDEAAVSTGQGGLRHIRSGVVQWVRAVSIRPESYVGGGLRIVGTGGPAACPPVRLGGLRLREDSVRRAACQALHITAGGFPWPRRRTSAMAGAAGHPRVPRTASPAGRARTG